MIHLTIDAPNAGELSDQLLGMAKLICGVPVPLAIKKEETPAEAPAPVVKLEPVQVETPRDAPKAEPVMAVANAPEEPVKADSPAPAPTASDVRAALNAYRQAHGSAATKDLLSKFGAASFTVLEESKYAAVLEACHAAQ